MSGDGAVRGRGTGRRPTTGRPESGRRGAGRLAPARLALAALGSAARPALAAVLVLGAVTGGLAVAQTALDRGRTAGIRAELAQVPVSTRDPHVELRGLPVSGPGSMAGASDEVAAQWGATVEPVDAVRAEGPAAAASVLGPGRALLRFDAADAVPPPGVARPDSQVFLTLDPLFATAASVVEGRAPEPLEEGADVAEVAVSSEVAHTMEWPVGEVRHVAFGERLALDLLLVGVFEARDPGDGGWAHATAALEPALVPRGLDPPLIQGAAYLDPRSLDALQGEGLDSSVELWLPLEVDRVTAGDLPALESALRSGLAQPLEVALYDGGFRPASLTSTAPEAIRATIDRDAALAGLLELVATGPIALALLVAALALRAVQHRQRPARVLLRRRGAARVVLAALGAAQGALLAALAVLLASIAVLAPGAAEPAALAVPALAAVLGATVVGGVAAVVGLESPTGELARRESRARGRLARAAALGLPAAAVLASVAVALRAGGSTASDPLLVLLPLLIGGSVALLALVGARAVLGALARPARAARGLVGLVGVARARRDGAVGALPVIALAGGVAVTAMALVAVQTLDLGLRQAARAAVGADIRVDDVYLGDPALDALAAIPGVRAVAVVEESVRADLATPEHDRQVRVVVADSAALLAVEGARPVLAAPQPGGDPVRVLASSALPVEVGTEAELDGVPIVVTGIGPAATVFGSLRSWVLVDAADADALGLRRTPGTALLAIEPGADPAAIARAAREVVGPDGAAVTLEEEAAARAADPTVGVLRGVLVATPGVLAALLLAVVLGAVLPAGRSRRQLGAVLAAFGARTRDSLGLGLVETLPVVAIAALAGMLGGLALSLVGLGAIGWDAITGAEGVGPTGVATAAALAALPLPLLAAPAIVAILARGVPRSRSAAILRGAERGD
ncbi:MAG: hypothetical protein J0G30_13055 [Actinomycetales bacterium]|nr:hypothetical protein [Actinomycetales bacterium]